MIEVKENGRSRKISKQRAMNKSLFAKAIKGDVRASEQLIKIAKEYLETEPENEKEGEVSIDDREIINSFFKRLRSEEQSGGDK